MACKDFVPLWLRFVIFTALIFVFQFTGGVYMAAVVHMAGSMSWVNSDVMMAGYTGLVGMTMLFPVQFRVMFRFENRTVLMVSLAVGIAAAIICMYCQNIVVVCIVNYIAGVFKMAGTFFCITILPATHYQSFCLKHYDYLLNFSVHYSCGFSKQKRISKIYYKTSGYLIRLILAQLVKSKLNYTHIRSIKSRKLLFKILPADTVLNFIHAHNRVYHIGKSIFISRIRWRCNLSIMIYLPLHGFIKLTWCHIRADLFSHNFRNNLTPDRIARIYRSVLNTTLSHAVPIEEMSALDLIMDAENMAKFMK